ncbi:hypothetical protein A2W14_00670 [Candidatus Gottesmanbacteria bacterium RBG_16_37_8]|uniref:LytR/CpsA/Psr regulator C-terminal domain-containing protein n=1 Tax=Candidatus Gottesmanbacteria bacterium RBG_16_37_8 TaxID=1798371 RepID=A0A1F5YTV2_9BACT|nr:MAG: hypothetical protein A2W14_00670 [Candidatus Gottesmanbacteria bacterium RBG_16_37_8]
MNINLMPEKNKTNQSDQSLPNSAPSSNIDLPIQSSSTNILKSLRLHPVILALIIILVIGVSTLAVYFFIKYRNTQKYVTNPQLFAVEENNKILEKIGKMMELPDEMPTIATISDKEKLKDQPFFAKAKNGDKVIIYTTARKAILYDPLSNKILDVAPLTVSSASATPIPEVTETKVLLYNGTATVGLTKKYESALKEKIPSAIVVGRENAAKQDYSKTILVDVKGNQTTVAENLAKLLNITTAALPSGETATDSSDFLIILGSDSTGK